MEAKMKELVSLLSLKPLEPEGGYFSEVFRDAGKLASTSLPETFKGDRAYSTSILYLLPSGQISRLHRLASAEVWHFYRGRPVVVTEIKPDGQLIETILGGDVANGQKLQHSILPGTWFGAHLGDAVKAGPFADVQQASDCALVGATVAPGFEYADFEMGNQAQLLEQFPQHHDVLQRLLPKVT